MQPKTCQLCGKRPAYMWVCLPCYEKLGQKTSPLPGEIPGVPFWPLPLQLFLLGFLLIFVGMILVMIASVFGGASTGAVIWILPFPPIFLGTGPHLYTAWAIILAIILTILGAILFIILRKQARRL